MKWQLHKPTVKKEEIPSKSSLANTFSGVCEYIFPKVRTMTELADILMLGKVAHLWFITPVIFTDMNMRLNPSVSVLSPQGMTSS